MVLKLKGIDHTPNTNIESTTQSPFISINTVFFPSLFAREFLLGKIQLQSRNGFATVTYGKHFDMSNFRRISYAPSTLNTPKEMAISSLEAKIKGEAAIEHDTKLLPSTNI